MKTVITMSEVQQIDIKKLRINQLNEKFFKPATGGDIDSLHKDIEERGILVPLIAKKGGTLLAGHRRYMIAQSIGLKKVPVQYVINDLTEKEEREFIIKDNMIRRHLTPEERKNLYNVLYKDFENRVKIKNSSTLGVKAQEIADATGINIKTVANDITNIRRQKETARIKASPIDDINHRELDVLNRSMSRMLNCAIMGSKATKKAFVEAIENALARLERMP